MFTAEAPSSQCVRGYGRVAVLLGVTALFLLAGCERGSVPKERTAGHEDASQAVSAVEKPVREGGEPAQPPTPEGEGTPVILCLGDSLTAGLGLSEAQSYPALLERRLQESGYHYRVVNAGVSGDTSAGGLSRLDWLLRQRVDIMILELGANDGLRGLSTKALYHNLDTIIQRARKRGIVVVLAGMKMPANYGADYQKAFAAVFPALAKRYHLPFIPFLLEGVAASGTLNQADGIHPNAAGTRIVTENVWRVLKPLLKRGP